MKLIIVSGRSGSGKSITLRVLEDLGFYCVDNLPMSLIPAFICQAEVKQELVAIGIDARNLSTDLTDFSHIFETVKSSVDSHEVIYLDADNETLLKRFSETRRKHPLTDPNTSLEEAIQKEKQLLLPIAEVADIFVDTRKLTMHELREQIRQKVHYDANSTLLIEFKSFGYKFGAPTDTDFMFDARCLPNPYWEVSLTGYSGREQQVIDFLESQPIVKEMYQDIVQFLETWIPRFEKGSRKYLTIGIGCTGGQHRSVYLVERIAKHFLSNYPDGIQVRHRELK